MFVYLLGGIPTPSKEVSTKFKVERQGSERHCKGLKGGVIMKYKAIIAIVLSFLLVDVAAAARETRVSTSRRNLRRVCTKVLNVGSASSTIYKNSAPLRSGGLSSPIIGFRKEPTLIMNRNISSRGTHPIYDSSGSRIATCPWASAYGHAGGRLRCTVPTSTVRRSATKRTKRPVIYFGVNRKTCVKVPDAGRCFGSVKGLCNQTIS